MKFEMIGDQFFIDGYLVPPAVYHALRPSKLFPADSSMSTEDAEEALAHIKATQDARQSSACTVAAISGAKPWISDALAVHPKQIDEVKARNRKHGLNIDYTRDGQPICTDAGQRRQLMKIEGVRQKNSYYGH